VELCPRCQARLSELAASDDEWTEAKQLLSSDSDEIDLDEFERSTAGRRTGRMRRRTLDDYRHPRAWTDSMAEQLLDPPSHPEMLGRIGRYEVERLIGAGGMGVVFKGFDRELNRPVALKVLAPHLAGSGAARKRFAREARAAAAVVNEHVVAIHSVESDHEPPYLVMQYVAGESLQGRLDREGPLDVCEILRIAHQTASALAAAHAQGLVHRDVKPSNILLEPTVERALLTDFGLARAGDDATLTRTGYLPGTPHYMSPEQARGERADARSDLFSLGSVIYAMCAGRAPFRAETTFGILRRISDNRPRPIREINPAIPDWLEAIVDKLHAKNANERFESAEQVAELLEQCLAHVQQPLSSPLPPFCRMKTGRRRRMLGMLAAFGAAGIAVAAVVAIVMNTNRPGNGVSSPSPRVADQNESNSDRDEPRAPVEPVSEFAAWDDGIGQRIDRLEQSATELKQEASRDWDDH
jgi:serine/threonine-protein kinase